MPKERIVISSNLKNSSNDCKKDLKLMMLCCEEEAPYGPAEDTAKMFLQLLCMAHEQLSSTDEKRGDNLNSISITVYHAQQEDYPSSKHEWESFDGIIIPGSLSSAYDTHIPWIGRLHQVIREEIHAHCRKTLAVCFGHQSFAHALGELDGSEDANQRRGEAVACPSGKKAGRKHFRMTSAGSNLFAKSDTSVSQKTCLEMLYTHGDMVASLPVISLSLGGNNDVPIQSAAYFGSKDLAMQFQQCVESKTKLLNDYDPKGLPYAFTLQAHPEFISPHGFSVNYLNILDVMEKSKRIDSATSKEAAEDARNNFDLVKMDSLDATVSIATTLGWF